MSGTGSNNGSDFECVDNQDQDVDVNEEKTVQTGDNPVLNYIVSFDSVNDNVVQKFREMKINFSHLKNLSDSDLEKLGVKTENTRRKMIEEFSKLPNQDQNYVEMVKMIDLQLAHTQMVEDMEQHVNSMKQLITGCLLKFNIHPPCDILIDDKKYTSVLLFEICEKLRDKTEMMHRALECLDNPDLLKEYEEARKRAKYSKILFGVIGFTMLGIALYKSKDKLFSF